ncbi:hypothetical protein DFH11DRAFT_1552797 [Phellopilus nigrolimitatus]|nr:hypothetical protein DFH11DRAFT_1552797 [Phellopilus nigrolimitatus]
MSMPKLGHSHYGHAHGHPQSLGMPMGIPKAWACPWAFPKDGGAQKMGVPKLGISYLWRADPSASHKQIPCPPFGNTSRSFSQEIRNPTYLFWKDENKELPLARSKQAAHIKYSCLEVVCLEIVCMRVHRSKAACARCVHKKLETDFNDFRHRLAAGLAFRTLDLKTKNAGIAAEVRFPSARVLFVLRSSREEIKKRRRKKIKQNSRRAGRHAQDVQRTHHEVVPHVSLAQTVMSSAIVAASASMSHANGGSVSSRATELLLKTSSGAINTSTTLTTLPGTSGFTIQSLTSNAPNTLLFLPRTKDGWDVMTDMFFYRDPEEIEKQQQQEAQNKALVTNRKDVGPMRSSTSHGGGRQRADRLTNYITRSFNERGFRRRRDPDEQGTPRDEPHKRRVVLRLCSAALRTRDAKGKEWRICSQRSSCERQEGKTAGHLRVRPACSRYDGAAWMSSTGFEAEREVMGEAAVRAALEHTVCRLHKGRPRERQTAREEMRGSKGVRERGRMGGRTYERACRAHTEEDGRQIESPSARSQYDEAARMSSVDLKRTARRVDREKGRPQERVAGRETARDGDHERGRPREKERPRETVPVRERRALPWTSLLLSTSDIKTTSASLGTSRAVLVH